MQYPDMTVIAEELDGAELRRRRRRKFIRADGEDAYQDIQDAIDTVARGEQWCIQGAAWQRIFGDRDYGRNGTTD